MISLMPAPILQVITDTDRRGAQVFATDLREAFVRMGRQVRTVALARGATGGLELPVLGPSRRSAQTFGALRKEIKNASVVLAHGSTTLPACAVASVGTGVPFVYRQISDSRFWAPSGLRRWRTRLALGRAAAVVALWEGSANTLRDHLGVRSDRIRVIANGVDPARFEPATPAERTAARSSLGLAPDAVTLLYAGALVPEKGVDRLVRAAAGLAGAQVIVAGDGPDRARLEAIVPTAARVTFTGSLNDLSAAYCAADVFVLPSRGGDSMPAVLIEAGLCGLPCVSTAIDAIPEIVVDGRTGVILDPTDESSWVGVLEHLRDDEDGRRAMGDAARRHCLEHYDVDVLARKWLAVVDEVRK
jgi:glycosyltransferase involved in cell wall biosynthesis